MPVELLDGQRLQVILDFAPLVNPSAAPTLATAAAGNDGKGGGKPSAAMLLGGLGVEGRKPRRVGVLLPKESVVADVKGLCVSSLGYRWIWSCVFSFISPRFVLLSGFTE